MKAGRRRNERKEQATVRQESRNKLNNVDQIAVLDKRLGPGVGATKERLRLSEIKTEKQEMKEVESPSVLEVKEEKFKVKKHQDPIKEKKKFKQQQKEGKVKTNE